MKSKYEFVTLRYIHDAVTMESVNLGVLVYSQEKRFLDLVTTARLSRVTAMFPEVRERHLLQLLDAIGRQAQELAVTLASSPAIPGSIADLIGQVLPTDDSALQWSAIGSGVAADLGKARDRLFERQVTKYLGKSRRSIEQAQTVLLVFAQPGNIGGHAFRERVMYDDTNRLSQAVPTLLIKQALRVGKAIA